MKISYDREQDIMMLELSNQKIDHAEQTGQIIAHFTKKDKPVLLEILDASNFLAATLMAQTNFVEKIQLNYDQKSDVLYINFDPPQPADDSDITDEGVIIRLRNNYIVGLTILNASKALAGPANA